MNLIKLSLASSVVAMNIILCETVFAKNTDKPLFGSIAVDEEHASYAAVKDFSTQAEAEAEALRMVASHGPDFKGKIFLTWSGSGCGSYRAVIIPSAVGTNKFGPAGWALGRTLFAAQEAADKDLLSRKEGARAGVMVETCNTQKAPPLKKIFEALRPANTDCILVFTSGLKSTTTGKYSDGISISSPIYRLKAEECPKIKGDGALDTSYNVSPFQSLNKNFATQKEPEILSTQYGTKFFNSMTQIASLPGTTWGDYVMVWVAKPNQKNIDHYIKWMMQSRSKRHICFDYSFDQIMPVDVLGKEVCKEWLK